MFPQEFVDRNPILSEFKAEILKFEALLEEVDAIPESIRVGAIQLETGKNKNKNGALKTKWPPIPPTSRVFTR